MLIATHHGLLLRALLHGDAPALERWLAAADLDRLDLASLRLMPLASRLHPAPLLQGLHRRCWARNQVLLRNTAAAAADLQAEGLPVMALKGLPLALTAYPDPGLRWMEDADLMVPWERRDQALDLLRRRGWQPLQKRTWEQVSPAWLEARHAHSFRSPGGAVVDLHWNLLLQRLGPRADRACWERARPLDLGSVEVLCPDPTHMLLRACLHAALWEPVPPLPSLVDAWLLCGGSLPPGDARAAEPIDWDEVLRLAREAGLAMPLWHALGWLRDQGAAVPTDCLARPRVRWLEARECALLALPSRSRHWWERLFLQWRQYRRCPRRLGFLAHLGGAWGLEGPGPVLRETARKAWCRLRGRRYER